MTKKLNLTLLLTAINITSIYLEISKVSTKILYVQFHIKFNQAISKSILDELGY